MRLLEEHEIPVELLEIPQAPKKLYIEGNLPPRGSVYLTVVGSRKFSSYGREACEKLIAGLRGYPVVIVSGLAYGIDTIAHNAALLNDLITIAFPGSGLGENVLYPAVNKTLVKKILDAGGALISELPPETKAAYWTFPQRNRLMAGLAKATLIIEAEDKSGTLITARLALDYNRDLLVIPGSIFSPTSIGTNSLLRLGATPITKVEELLLALGFSVDTEKKINRELEDCSPDEKLVLEILREPYPRDELLRLMKMDTAKANTILSVMEIKGLIKEEMGEIRRA